MSIKLRELIRKVRACKTAADERAVISKECALIRTAFKAKGAHADSLRHRNVAKLLYIHMLGYPTHFGQMESLKLVASPKFAEKRIGYLGLMILLDERQQVLMLVTNSLKNDFHHANPYVAGLALCSLGNISSAEIARDLQSEVEKFFTSSNAYLRKKAALCACRIIRKAPDLTEDFVTGVTHLLSDKNHAVLLTGITLIIEMIKVDPKMADTFRKHVPTLVRLLKNLLLSGYVSEYDVSGITDPFLQSRIIHLLRLLGTGSADASDQMNDILAQVAINTEPTKNPGNAILYETVMTIMSIEAEGGLRVLAINILGRFLTNRDNNIRYVALSTLCKVVNKDAQAIQRHRNTIVDCLKDSDISIRRRALDLIYALVTKNNVKALVKELLNYLALTSGDREFKSDLTDKICMVAERFAPGRRWHIDVIISVLATAGNFTKDNVATDLIFLISRSSEHSAYCAHKLFQILKKKTQQLPLIHVALWVIGEFGGEQLLSDEGAKAANDDDESGEGYYEAVDEGKLLDVLRKTIKLPIATIVTREYALTAMIKLTTHFTEETDRLRALIGTYRSSMSLELQQRSCEFFQLYSEKMDSIRPGVVARMPVLKKKTTSKKQKGNDDDEDEDDDSDSEDSSSGSSDSDSDSDEDGEAEQEKKQPVKAQDSGDLLSSLFGDSGGGGAAAAAKQPSSGQQQSSGNAAAAADGLDMLADLFGDSSIPAAVSPAVSNGGGGALDLDIFGMGGGAPAAAAPAIPSQQVHNSKGLTITFAYTKNPAAPNALEVIASFSNSNSADMTGFDFQVAVPKYLKLKMDPASGTTVKANGAGQTTQKLTLTNSMHGQKKIVIRVRIQYTINGNPITEQAQIANFP